MLSRKRSTRQSGFSKTFPRLWHWAAGASLFAGGCALTQDLPDSPLAHAPITQIAGEKLQKVSFSEKAGGISQRLKLPINLDTVLRLAEEQNPQIAIAVEKLEESNGENALAAKSWLPAIYGGIAYYRHEGGIQNFNGDLIQSSTGALYPNLEIRTEIDLREATYKQVVAERNHWKSRGELARITTETCLEAATTYVDLLTARRGEAVARELEKYFVEQLERAEKMKQEQPEAAVLVEAVHAELSGRKQAILKLKQLGDHCSIKLTYLLGIDPETQLVPVEKAFVPIDLVELSIPTSDMVARSLAYGPGIAEIEGMLASVQTGLARLEGSNRFMPILQLNMAEGGFGAGAGDSLYWANRWDLGLAAKWNLTEWHTSREKRRIAEIKINQVQLTHKELKAKLTLGVQESRDSISGGREQTQLGTKQIHHAAETYRLNSLRLEENAPGTSMSDVLQSIRGLETAHTGYITSINVYNKAQIRLMMLLGPDNAIHKKGEDHDRKQHASPKSFNTPAAVVPVTQAGPALQP
ncbi:MAG: TolC family protein [Gemmataceae bacterium]|nr:TolC family protein [Gemmataceae bacterium]